MQYLRNRLRCCVKALAVCCLSLCVGVVVANQPPSKSLDFQVYAFCHDTHDAKKRDFPQQAAMLKSLGFAGVGHVGLDHIEQRVRSLDDAELRLYLAGVTLNLKEDIEKPVEALRAVLPLLQGRGAVLYVVITGLPSGDPAGMVPAVAALRRLSDLVAATDVRIGIYPHTGDWVATVPQAVSLARNTQRDNCGLIFNLCHFLRNERVDTLNDVLHQAAPYLVGVTINGADLAGRNDKDWKRLIQPLDCGSFDLAALLEKLIDISYRGPVGIMCYGIGGDAQAHLTRSMHAWRALRARQK